MAYLAQNQSEYEKFSVQLPRLGSSAPDELLPQLMTARNIIGKGRSKQVFRLPGIDGYVLAFIKKEFHSDLSFRFPRQEIADEFPGMNFGQPIAHNGNGLYILKKVDGEEHSLSCWSDKYNSLICGQSTLTAHDACLFLYKIDLVQRMPLRSFVDFAAKFSLLNQKNIRLDTINANNVLIDHTKQDINIVDIDYAKEVFPTLHQPYNTISDMRNLLLDSLLHKELHDKLPPAEQQHLRTASLIIAQKCRYAGTVSRLPDDSYNSYEFLRVLQERLTQKHHFSTRFIENYATFQKLYDSFPADRLNRQNTNPSRRNKNIIRLINVNTKSRP